MKKLIMIMLTCVFALCVNAQAQKDSVRILWIGNSFTFYNDLPDMFSHIAQTQGMKVSNTKVLKGGERFAGHLKNQRLLDILKKDGFDYVILQEQSSIPADRTVNVAKQVFPYAKTLAEKIRENSPKAQLIFYMTWGHKYGNVRAKDSYPLDHSYEGMQERLKTSYLEMAYDNDAWCAPVGMAWQAVRYQRPNLQLYQQDCFHPSRLGTYLAANTIFTTMTQRPYQSDATEGIEVETAEYIQQVAQRMVLDNLRLLNVK